MRPDRQMELRDGRKGASAHDRGFRWNDPAVGIAWPIRDPLLSEKDAALPTLAELRTLLGK